MRAIIERMTAAWSSGSILITLCTRSAIFLVRFISIMDAVWIRSSGTSSVGEPAGRALLRQTRGVGNVDDDIIEYYSTRAKRFIS